MGVRAQQCPLFTFHLSGGRLCLDFANTVSWRGSGEPVERLGSYADLVAWGRQTGGVTEPEARRLLREGGRRPAAAARALSEAIRVREAIYRIFSNIVDGRSPAPADLATLNADLSDALSRLQVVGKGGEFAWQWRSEGEALRSILWPVVRSAAELLASRDLGYLRKCAAENCRWIFLDTTRNRSRRWCDMRVCGNRAKVRRHYQRLKRTRT